MSPRATQQDVARLAGVSTATVSYVLSGRKDRVNGPSPETRERVHAAAETLQYRGNVSARMFRRQRTEIVAILYQPPLGPWLEHMLVQTEDQASMRGYSLICVPILRRDRLDRSLRAITKGLVDGAILANGVLPGMDLVALADATRGLVVFDDDQEPSPHVDTVRSGERQAIAQATSYLIERGHERIAYLMHEIDRPKGQYDGYVDALHEAGREPDPALIASGAGDPARSIAALESLLGVASPPDALISESDRGALLGLQVARAQGMRVPDDLAVIGVGNTTYAEVADPPLTSVGMPAFDFTPVIEALFDRIENPGREGKTISLGWELNIRATT